MTVDELIDELSKLSDVQRKLDVVYMDCEYGATSVTSIEYYTDEMETSIRLR